MFGVTRLLGRARDAAFRFVEREGDFTLHFFADFLRGHWYGIVYLCSSFEDIGCFWIVKKTAVFFTCDGLTFKPEQLLLSTT